MNLKYLETSDRETSYFSGAFLECFLERFQIGVIFSNISIQIHSAKVGDPAIQEVSITMMPGSNNRHL